MKTKFKYFDTGIIIMMIAILLCVFTHNTVTGICISPLLAFFLSRKDDYIRKQSQSKNNINN